MLIYYFIFYLGLHYFTNSSFHKQPAEEKWMFTNPKESRAFELQTSAEECSDKKSNLWHSGVSLTNNIHPFEISSDFSVKSALVSYDKKNEVALDSNNKTKIPIHSDDTRNECLSYHSSKFDVEVNVQSGKISIGSILDCCSSKYLEQNKKSNISPCSMYSLSPNFSSKCRSCSLDSKDHIHSSKSTPTNEGKQGRRNRIAAQFAAPIND